MFVIAIILGAIGVIALAGGIATHKKNGGLAFLPGIGGLLLGVLFLILASLTTVPAQSSGVVTRFNRPTGTVFGPGIHWKSPLDRVHDMDGTIQTIDNEGKGATTVRLNSNVIMTVANNLRWRIRPVAAPKLLVDWKKFDHIQDGLVSKELVAALNVALAGYDPLDPAKVGQSHDELAKAVTDRMNQRIGGQIEIISFTIQRIDFDPDTQKRLNTYNEQVAKTRTAEEQEKTAAAEARANKVLAGSVSKDPNVLVSKCLDILKQMSDKGQQVPAAFSCWPGEGTPITVQGGGQK